MHGREPEFSIELQKKLREDAEKRASLEFYLAQKKHDDELKRKEKIKTVIQKAIDDKSDTLHLKSCELTSSELKSLISEIHNITNLISLDLSNNLLTAVDSLTDLTNLTSLTLAYNKLQDGTPLKNLTSLIRLDLSNTKLSNYDFIKKLTSLTSLALGFNGLSNINFLREMKQLTELDLNFNNLSNVSFLREFTNLVSLDLTNNNLSDIPSLKELKNLEFLYIAGNKNIEKKIGNVKNDSNPKTILKACLDWQEAERTKNLKPLNEAKIILIGQGNVGKSSLRISLLQGKCEERQKKTEGLEVVEWNLNIDKNKHSKDRFWTSFLHSNQIKFNVWDFGGQEIYHTTHQYFFDSECLYILVADYSGRVEWRTNRLGYWLATIQMLAKKDTGESRPAVIIVGNKADEQGDYKLTLENINNEINRAREKYRDLDIVGFIPVSCQNGENIYEPKSSDEPCLVDVIKSQFEKVGIKRQIPQKYLDYKKKIKDSGKYFIEFNDFEQFCPEETDLMRSIFHSIGIITSFRENKKIKSQKLKDLIVLNYEWITKGIYKILSANHLLETNDGIATKEEIRGLLDEKKYPNIEYVIEMMKEFYLCSSKFEYDKGGNQIEKFFFPKFFSNKTPSFVKIFRNNSSENRIDYKYTYNFISDNIIAFFIIKASDKFGNADFWKDGCLITEDETQALVESDDELNEISIIVKGNNANGLLIRVREIFEEIHRFSFIPKPNQEFESLRIIETLLQDKIKNLEDEIEKLKREKIIIMNQQFNNQNSQVGSQGNQNEVKENILNQQINSQTVDFQALSNELERLLTALNEKATNIEDGKAIVKVENAKEAADEKDENKVVKYLKEGGKFVFDTAKEIGTKVVTNLIEKQITGG